MLSLERVKVGVGLFDKLKPWRTFGGATRAKRNILLRRMSVITFFKGDGISQTRESQSRTKEVPAMTHQATTATVKLYSVR